MGTFHLGTILKTNFYQPLFISIPSQKNAWGREADQSSWLIFLKDFFFSFMLFFLLKLEVNFWKGKKIHFICISCWLFVMYPVFWKGGNFIPVTSVFIHFFYLRKRKSIEYLINYHYSYRVIDVLVIMSFHCKEFQLIFTNIFFKLQNL